MLWPFRDASPASNSSFSRLAWRFCTRAAVAAGASDGGASGAGVDAAGSDAAADVCQKLSTHAAELYDEHAKTEAVVPRQRRGAAELRRRHRFAGLEAAAGVSDRSLLLSAAPRFADLSPLQSRLRSKAAGHHSSKRLRGVYLLAAGIVVIVLAQLTFFCTETVRGCCCCCCCFSSCCRSCCCC